MASQPTTPLRALTGLNLVRLDDKRMEAGEKSPAVGPTIRSEALWQHEPALMFVVRRPGCVLCREQALALAARRQLIEEEYGVKMHAVVLEELGAMEFQKNFWKGPLYLDTDKGFFKATNGGHISKVSSWNILRPTVLFHGRRATLSGVKGNFIGEGRILGGVFVVRPGDQGVAYEYFEKFFGDHAPMDDMLPICQSLVQG
ncbi:hypothetical protein H4R34_002633 [Dimargaris verticillata]|uniref:Peroxiredoxin-like 2A n=1 Tax=Dimargaris verticillata TaxID=2761393 RepID=A0A9W8B3K0_9FUNG|nr:hypothetical protein H4R34_002633 [Dimargaris verticillata]